MATGKATTASQSAIRTFTQRDLCAAPGEVQLCSAPEYITALLGQNQPARTDRRTMTLKRFWRLVGIMLNAATTAACAGHSARHHHRACSPSSGSCGSCGGMSSHGSACKSEPDEHAEGPKWNLVRQPQPEPSASSTEKKFVPESSEHEHQQSGGPAMGGSCGAMN